jgi:hypothetical protein
MSEDDSSGRNASSLPSQSAPQSTRIRWSTIRQLCIRCWGVRAWISPRVPRKVSFILFSNIDERWFYAGAHPTALMLR